MSTVVEYAFETFSGSPLSGFVCVWTATVGARRPAPLIYAIGCFKNVNCKGYQVSHQHHWRPSRTSAGHHKHVPGSEEKRPNTVRSFTNDRSRWRVATGSTTVAAHRCSSPAMLLGSGTLNATIGSPGVARLGWVVSAVMTIIRSWARAIVAPQLAALNFILFQYYYFFVFIITLYM